MTRPASTRLIDTVRHILPFRKSMADATAATDPRPGPDTPVGWRNLSGHNRRGALLYGIDPATSRGLEFGPLTSPLVGRHEGPIEYVDHATTEALRRKYATNPEVDVANIVEVDHVLDDGRLPESVATGAYDYIVACHVFEHLPNPLAWLLEAAGRLRPGGTLCLAVPDKRFTFDRARPLTRLAEWVDALLEERRRPPPRSVFEAAMLSVSMPLAVTWSRPPQTEELKPRETQGKAGWAMTLAREAAAGYFDVHCSVFTPESCLLLLADAAESDLHPFTLAGFGDTASGAYEFYLQMVPAPQRPGADRANIFRQAAARAHAGSPYDQAAA